MALRPLSSKFLWSVRALAWGVLFVIFILSLSPPGLRPETPIAHQLEHASIFFLGGALLGFGYAQWLTSVLISTVMFSALIELAQLVVPGRHARLSDFLVDATAALAGVVLAASQSPLRGRSDLHRIG
jgi:VanZ family protein